MQKLFMLLGFTIATTSMSYGQLKIEPKVCEINNLQQFVIVIKGDAKSMGKVLMSDGNASTFDFDPNNIDTYPTWSIERIRVDRSPASPLFYTTFMCTSNQKYFAFGKAGDDKMITKEEHDKYWEKDAAGNNKYNISDMYFFVYREFVQDDNQHIKLTWIADKKDAGSSYNVKMKTWPSDKLKLVFS